MMKKSFAFTLGEILISLGVIGIVASLVLPLIISGKKAAEAKAGFSTAYSLLSQAITEMDANNESVKPASYTTGQFYEVYKNHFNVTIDCAKYGSEGVTNKDVCFSTGSRDSDNSYKKFSGDLLDDAAKHWLDDGSFVLNNGMLIMIENYLNNPILIFVDINGKNKLPNRMGFDLFGFELTDNGELLPIGAPGTKKMITLGGGDDCQISETGVLSGRGLTCSYKAFSNQDYFDKIYKGH